MRVVVAEFVAVSFKLGRVIDGGMGDGTRTFAGKRIAACRMALVVATGSVVLLYLTQSWGLFFNCLFLLCMGTHLVVCVDFRTPPPSSMPVMRVQVRGRAGPTSFSPPPLPSTLESKAVRCKATGAGSVRVGESDGTKCLTHRPLLSFPIVDCVSSVAGFIGGFGILGAVLQVMEGCCLRGYKRMDAPTTRVRRALWWRSWCGTMARTVSWP